MRAILPEAGMTTFRKEMDRLFDRFWDGDEMPSIGAWSPRVDVFETKDDLTIKAEVPGLEPKDIQVTLENGVLTFGGEKKADYDRKDGRFYKAERVYGSFSRSLRLPANVDGSKVNATFHNGVLTIMLPKTVEARGLAIPIGVS